MQEEGKMWKPVITDEIEDEGLGGETQMEDEVFRWGLRKAPKLVLTEDEHQLMAQELAAQIKQLDNPMNHKSLEEIDELQDEDADDDFLEKYRRKRLAELSKKIKKPVGLREIEAEQFEAEVKPEGKGWVVMTLYRPSHPESQLLLSCMEKLAHKFPAIKWLKLEGSYVKSFPLEHAPTVLTYLNGKKCEQFVQLSAFHGVKTTADVVEWTLSQSGVLESELEKDPRFTTAKFKMSRHVVRKSVYDEDESSDSNW